MWFAIAKDDQWMVIKKAKENFNLKWNGTEWLPKSRGFFMSDKMPKGSDNGAIEVLCLAYTSTPYQILL